MCTNDDNVVVDDNYGRPQDLILLWDASSKTFVCPGLVTVTTLSTPSFLMVQSSVNGVTHTSNKCDISTNFDLGLLTCSF
jgi:hypothetical protein